MTESIPSSQARRDALWTALLLASGAVSLGYEAVWIRRLGLVLGGSAVASAIVVAAFMGGLAMGGALAKYLPRGARGPRSYAILEATAALWAFCFPWLLDAMPFANLGVAFLLLAPPATALGATWPLLAQGASPALASRLYAANTTGAVLGVAGTTFFLLPNLGVRGTEYALVGTGLLLAIVATHTTPLSEKAPAPAVASLASSPWVILAASAAAGFTALGLEVVWMRLAAVALGATVQTIGLVLATFLATMAVGAWIGRRWPNEPMSGLGYSLAALTFFSLVGCSLWGQLPYLVAEIYDIAGPAGMRWGAAVVATVLMGGAPIASGMAFSLAIRALGTQLESQAGPLYTANTAGGIAGSLLAGLWALPVLEVRGAVFLFAGVSALASLAVLRKPLPVLPALLVAVLVPAWDAKLYAVGIHLRVSDFSDTSPRAIRSFADEGWELRYYNHGTTGAVAVGQSTKTGNLWLSINGKVDASTGDDMPTQILSGTLPMAIHGVARDVLVVGLASGITAGAVLDSGADKLTVVELEPAVIEASRFFDDYSGAPLDDVRTTLIIEDARAVLRRGGDPYDVIISEPSNPWITGVSSLFTEEYWHIARRRLTDDGVFCQWVQLYGMGPDEFRGVIRTFNAVFPNAYLFETIPGSDVLLIGGRGTLPDMLPIQPVLSPNQVRALGGTGWLNTDDRPRVEWEAPKWLHYATATDNAALIEAARLTPP